MREIIKHENERLSAELIQSKKTDNYISFSDFSLFYRHFAYVDVPGYLADDLFAKYNLHIVYDKELVHPDHKYKVILCKILRWEAHKFYICMRELKDKMLVCGHGDYIEFCRDLKEKMDMQ